MSRLKVIVAFVLAITLCPASAQNKPVAPNQHHLAYIAKYKDLAIEQMRKHHIPASITLAQGILESRAGLSDLAVKGNNHFGIKCHGWTGATTYHDDDELQECFRAYKNARESYEDHSLFLVNGRRYRQLFQLKETDYKGWAHGLKACGYATNPQYAYSLIELIERYNLHDFDTGKHHHHTGSTTPSISGDEHSIFMYNKNLYIVARQGDTFKSIGKELEISYRKLARVNERDKNDTLNEGDIVYLKKKQTKATKDYKGKFHIVQPDESLYSIAQKYGIQLKSLYKKNNLSPDYQIRVGDRLKVY